MSFSFAIHQPNFFPWLGFFHKISLVERFYFMDHVQATMGKGWHSRVKILFDGQEKWLTVPIIKSGHSGQKYYDVQIDVEKNFEKKHLGTLAQAYKNSSYKKDVLPIIEKYYEEGASSKLSERNIILIQDIVKKIG